MSAEPPPPPPHRRGGPVRHRSLDPHGKRALFESPVDAARDTIGSGPPSEGKDALYSAGPRRPGTVVVICASCDAHTRITWSDLALRLATISIWVPLRPHGHWLRCPACSRRTWCHVGWQN